MIQANDVSAKSEKTFDKIVYAPAPFRTEVAPPRDVFYDTPTYFSVEVVSYVITVKTSA